MSFAALALFALAAVGGLVLALKHFGQEAPSLGLALAHGGLAATALVLAVAAYVTNSISGEAASISLGTLVVAALGGFYLFSHRFRKASAPRSVVAIHALVAVVGVALFTIAVFT